MRILITNDDGVLAPGLAGLHEALKEDHEVFVVAPETEQSAVGHAITLANPIKVRPLEESTGFCGYAVSGTPADCVKLALQELMTPPPDMVVSGINQGANLGANMLYSGTVSAATEASLQKVPAIAFSLDSHHSRDFSSAARFAAHLVKNHHRLRLPANVPLNVNVPSLPLEKIKGVRLAHQSGARLIERFVRRKDPWGHVYYWQAGETIDENPNGYKDYSVVAKGYITITPIRTDLTHETVLTDLNGFDLGLPQD